MEYKLPQIDERMHLKNPVRHSEKPLPLVLGIFNKNGDAFDMQTTLHCWNVHENIF
jgi:hypothetical protein